MTPNMRTDDLNPDSPNPWVGSAKWAKVKSSGEVGKVIPPGVTIGKVSCTAVHFPSTGEVRLYTHDAYDRCDEHGNTEAP